ncbi:Kelch repeat-containing protein [Aquimarina algiphila]|uniref:Kelch repeat-containing protein n=1 Tax=Aquimarina algiphila TaxID=2047982 RepID=UPI00248F9DFC|nr:kelch repeat-containing protein [Aquimarina algiphila]
MKYFSFILLTLLIFNCTSNSKWKTIDANGTCTVRHECGFVAHNNALYLIGGRGIKPVDRFDVNTNSWEALTATPIEMNHITPVSINGSIYIVSGLTGNYPKEKTLTHVYKFNSENNSWETVFEIPKERRRGGAGVTIHNNKIYIANGIIDGHTSGTSALFDVYDPKNNTWKILPDAPTKRDHSSAVVIDKKLVSLGGRNTSYHEPNNFEAFFKTVIKTVDYFDFETQQWSTYKNELPNPAAGSGTVVLGKKLYFFGGETAAKEASNLMYSFNIDTKEWTKEPSLDKGRHGTNAVVLNNAIYIASGSGNQGGGPELTSIEIYN